MNAEDFKQRIFETFLRDVHHVETDNYAWERFSADGIDRSALFDVTRHAGWLDWFGSNSDRLFVALGGLADQASRDLLIDLIRYRLAGHLHVRIRSKVAGMQLRAQQFREAFVGRSSTAAVSGMFGGLMHYDHEWEGTRYTIDTVKDALLYPLVYRQYWFERGGALVQPGPGDYVIDGGSFMGETACVFARSVGPLGRVYTFDPVQNHLEVVRVNVQQMNCDNVTIVGCGISDRQVDGDPIRLDGYDAGWRVKESSVPLCRIDDLVSDGTIPRVDFIKLDVEGSELAALRGAAATLRKFKPKLAVSIYHKPNDYFDIQRFVHDQGLGYRFYVDHYTTWAEETVLYAQALPEAEVSRA